jgi:hypothetical protein
MKLNNILIRPAKIIDSDRISELEKEYYSVNPSNFKIPKSSKRIRREIGSSMLMTNKTKYLVAEINTKIIGFIEIRLDEIARLALISLPFVDLKLESQYSIQEEILEYTLKNLKEMKIKRVQIELSLEFSPLSTLLEKFKFNMSKTIFEVWEGQIKPEILDELPDINIRPIKPKDSQLSYSWVENQLDVESPLFINYEAYRRLFSAPKNMIDGWAIAERDDKPVAIISSFVDEQDNVVVFGPFCSAKNQDVRIPLFNELLWMYKLKGKNNVRVLRIKSFMNDEMLFTSFGLDLTYLINLYERKL